MSPRSTLQAELLQANFANLTAFWTACGTTEHRLSSGRALHSSLRWPWRLWLDPRDSPTAEDLDEVMEAMGRQAQPMTMPQWPQRQGADETSLAAETALELKMTQELMVGSQQALVGHPSGVLQLSRVSDKDSAAEWTKIASESFGYSIDEPVIATLIDAPGFHLFLAKDDDAAVGTGLLLKTAEIVGVHMVGVPPNHRRKGYARQIMFGLLSIVQDLDCKYVTLQASAAAKPLYEQLGFESQGQLMSYRRK